MVRATPRRGAMALVAVVLAAGSLGWAPSASARPAAACPVGDGITVVVDFGSLGGGVQIRCVTAPVSSGFDALRAAGFTFAGTQRFPGLLCRIDEKPADDPCVNAPPSSRYWAYWTAAAPGGRWTYSDRGAGNRVPPPGSVEGWAFAEGCDRKPGGGPCPDGTTTTTTTTSSSTATRPTTTTATTTAASSGGVGVTPSTRVRVGDAPASDGSSTTTDPGAEADRAPAAEEEGEAELSALGGDAASPDGRDGPGASSGSVAGVVVGALAVVGLGGAGLVTARRRRAAEGGA